MSTSPSTRREGTGAPDLRTHPTGISPEDFVAGLSPQRRVDDGREGDTFRLGFSPRKAAVSLYGLQGHPRSGELLGRLGKHRTGASCVYVSKLADIDPNVLRELVSHAWACEPRAC